MLVILVEQQGPIAVHHLQDCLVRLPHPQPGKQFHVIQVAAITTHRTGDRQIVQAANLEVFFTVPWRRVHRTGASLGRHMVTHDHGYITRIKRMVQAQVLQDGAFCAAQFTHIFQAQARSHRIFQLSGKHEVDRLTMGQTVDQDVVQLRMQSHGFVGGQGPWGRGPDGDASFTCDRFRSKSGKQGCRIHRTEHHVDRR